MNAFHMNPLAVLIITVFSYVSKFESLDYMITIMTLVVYICEII
jgi:hypothetical protein